MSWMHGYYAESGYTYGYYPETMPLRLYWAALLQGHQAPTEKFRYLDAGCGQGLNLVLAAAAHPDSEFVGIDFLPDHIAHGRKLAKECGLTNVRFIEGDFVALADDSSGLGSFDYVVSHGIATWIAPQVRKSLLRMVGEVLNPSGVYYNSYNTYPGWLGVVPFQHMVLLEQQSKAGPEAIEAVLTKFKKMKACAPKLFNMLPTLQSRLDSMAKQDKAYLTHEYSNQDWEPVFVSQMIDEMAACKLNYLGTATLPEAFNAVLQGEVRELLSQESSAGLREQMKDFVLNQAFRRDLYVKGFNRPWVRAHEEMLRSVRFMVNPLASRPDVGEPFKIKGGAIELLGDAGYYNALLAVLDKHPNGLSAQQLISETGASSQETGKIIQAMTLLLHGGWVWIQRDLPASKGNSAQVNAAIAKAVNAGAPYKFVSLPVVGSALALGELDWYMLELLATVPAKGGDSGKLEERLALKLAELNRNLVDDGKVVTDPKIQRTMLADKVAVFQNRLLPLLKKLGAV